jgi:hypothetical protein
MSMSKSLRYGVAGLPIILSAGTGAQPAVAQPVEYVRVCDAFGTGFFYIPGTDTCLRVGGALGGGFGDNFETGFGQGYASLRSNSGWGVQGEFEKAWRDTNDAWNVNGSVFFQNPNSFHVAGFIRYGDYTTTELRMKEIGVDAAFYNGPITIQASIGMQRFEPRFGDEFDIGKFALHVSYYVNDSWKVGGTIGRVSGFNSAAIGTEFKLGYLAEPRIGVRGFVTGRWVERGEFRQENSSVIAGLKVNFGAPNTSMMNQDRSGHIDLLQAASHYAGLPPVLLKK